MYYESHKGRNLGKVVGIRLSDVMSKEQIHSLSKSSEYGQYSVYSGGFVQKLMPDTGGFRSYEDALFGNKIDLKHCIKFTDNDIMAEIRYLDGRG